MIADENLSVSTMIFHSFKSIKLVNDKHMTLYIYLIIIIKKKGNQFVNYDYLDTEQHDEYSNAWLKNQGYRQFPNEYTNEYTEKWLEYASLSNKKNMRVQYTSTEFFDILNSMGEEPVPSNDILNKLEQMYHLGGALKTVYQPIRNPINPLDNIVEGFSPGIPITTKVQLCARCKAQIMSE
ncbi:hypothetical protein BD770DRAFT_393955 [Pilaira anomala]|nr:hypothetical protein BD770DRAFT_393955 [Pilaira anomala]